MKATETTQAAKDFIEITRHKDGVTYKCLKCGRTREANAYSDDDHKAWMDHAAKCKDNLQGLAQAQAQEPAASNPTPAPADLNELKQRVEESGEDWNEALALLKVGTGRKDIADAIQEGWTVEDFWKILQAVDQPTVSAEEDAEVEAMIKRDFGAGAKPAPKAPKEEPILPGLSEVEEPAAPDPTPALHNGHTEAPASFNVKAISPQGFDIMLTLRANDTGELLGRIEKALAWLTSHNFTPASARNSGGSGNGPSANSDDGKQKYCTQKRDDAGFCPVHGKEMKKSQHHPGYYCPAKV